jgi:hypothetical protein
MWTARSFERTSVYTCRRRRKRDAVAEPVCNQYRSLATRYGKRAEGYRVLG